MDSYMPVKIISGKDCVLKKGSCIKKYGKKCLIVTGKHSAEKSGALFDVKKLLESNCIEYRIFDKIEPNPETLTCKEAGECAREYGADFIFGVGGGSVLVAPETRSSSPLRITRGEDLNSTNVRGLYPCGEGAGYAGGIMSAAVDGMKCAEAIIDDINE